MPVARPYDVLVNMNCIDPNLDSSTPELLMECLSSFENTSCVAVRYQYNNNGCKCKAVCGALSQSAGSIYIKRGNKVLATIPI